MPSLGRVSLMCFTASYAVALVIECIRATRKMKIGTIWAWIFTLAGLIAHTAYLIIQAKEGLTLRGAPLSSWYHWCLVAAWLLALAGLAIALTRPDSSVGIFFLPLVLGLIALACLFPKDKLFSPNQAARFWGLLHGIGLLLGWVSVLTGFATGLMYLLQSRRLKNKIPPNKGITLPSLEWLGHANERSLLHSAFWLTIGLLGGIILNLVQYGSESGLPWSDPTVWTSAVLFIWLIVVTAFSLIYKPARMGRKVAYLTLANFVILALTMGMVLFGPSRHTNSDTSQQVDSAMGSFSQHAGLAGFENAPSTSCHGCDEGAPS